MNAPIKQCAWCDGDYLRTRFDKKTCSKKCSAAFSHSKHCPAYKRTQEKKKILEGVQKLKAVQVQELFLDVQGFIFQMRDQHFICDAIDLLRLVSLFDRVYPSTQRVPSQTSGERASNIMFFKIVNWWRINTGKEAMPKPDFKAI